jgi:glycosyltransferase involved in cell wall biosynthesis
MTPLVSILIPAYNAAPWIADCLASALAQTWKPAEIIVIDDGSRDDTLALARSHESLGVRVVAQSNAGAAAARNHALRLASGDFIQFLDADDLLSPRKIELQLALLATRPAGTLATCRWGRFESDPVSARFVDEAVFHDFAPLDWLVLHASQARMMHPGAWLIPRAVAQRAGPWDESLSLNDDGEYFARIVLASTGLAFTTDADAATFYRSNLSGSLSRRRSAAAWLSLYLSGQLLEDHLLAAEDTPRVRQALADHWRLLAYELHPEAPALSHDAEQRSTSLGGSRAPLPMGPRARRFSRVFGWRLTARLRHLLVRSDF